MKTSPWKFLVGLTSRRRQEQEQGSPIENDTDPKAFASAVEQRSALLLDSTEASATPDSGENVPVDRTAAASNDPGVDPAAAGEVLPPGYVGELSTSTRDAADHSSAEADELVEENETRKPLRRTQRIKRPAPAKRVRARAVAESAVDTNEDQSTQTLATGKSAFLDDVAGLDAEINQLKSQLAQKLYLQNLQLKKMLERFDVS
ncbi:hypothetical protein AB4Z52_21405 [Rhizobium sp. 2YAF20]|uniref:hypothetical protein n=1 Tax=Rhizobium sp. 2YAF20 TaxID=3233027 RepID=UPI003F9A7B0A